MPVTKDSFRVEQKKMCSRTGGRNGVYGCSCCRQIGHLGDFKKYSRKLAKVRVNRSTKDEIAQALLEMPDEVADKESVEMYGFDYWYDPRDFDKPGDYYPDPATELDDSFEEAYGSDGIDYYDPDYD